VSELWWAGSPAVWRATRLAGRWVGFLGLSCVFALAWVLVLGSFLPGDIGVAGWNPS